MERREKTEFILEQMRFLIMVARAKDAEKGVEGKGAAIGGGEADWVKVRVAGRKVNEPFLKEKDNEASLNHPSFFLNGEITINTYAAGSETEILRHDDPIRPTKQRIPRCHEALLQSVGNTCNQSGGDWSWSNRKCYRGDMSF